MGLLKIDETPELNLLYKHKYKNIEELFYTCSICGGEYLIVFFKKECGQIMCIDCWKRKYG